MSDGHAETTAVPGEDPDGAKAAKRARKAQKRAERSLRDALRPLQPWERYRALQDVIEEGEYLEDLADHKVRFAALIMGALNAGLFIVGTRTEVVEAVPPGLGTWLLVLLVPYVLVSLGFFVQAIEALRPRRRLTEVPDSVRPPAEDQPLGVRSYEDILRRSVHDYLRAWQEIRLGQLNMDLATRAYELAAVNRVKYTALRRLYLGLRIMTAITVGLIVLLAVALI